ncbi:MAG: hypothetical protein ACRD0Y_13840 [Terriglobales bacterium]
MMVRLHHAPATPPPAGILASRRAADAALLRVFSRARRRGGPLLLLRMEIDHDHGRSLPRDFLTGVAAQMRINDLAWREAGAGILLLIEDADDAAPLASRIRERAAQHGLSLRMHQAQFPRHGLTLDALLVEVGWRA